MRTLALVNGDIQPGPGGYVEVTGREKLIQDLSLALREPFGGDPFHGRWGSLLDSYVGRRRDSALELLVQSEITRVIQNYLAVKYTQMQLDASAGTRSRFDPGEIITDITSIEVAAVDDSLYIRVTLRTMDKTALTISQTVSP